MDKRLKKFTIADRLAILHEYETSDLTASHEEAYEVIKRFITFYNDSRPHMSIDYQTPSVAHQQVGTQQRHWKGYQERCQQNQYNICQPI